MEISSFVTAGFLCEGGHIQLLPDSSYAGDLNGWEEGWCISSSKAAVDLLPAGFCLERKSFWHQTKVSPILSRTS